MSNYMRRLLLLRRPAQVADPGDMVDLRVEDGSWRQGFFRALCAPSTAETGEVLIWVCKEDEYKEARWEDHRTVGMRWTAERTRVSPSPKPWCLSYRYRCPRGQVRLNKEGRAIDGLQVIVWSPVQHT